MDGVGMPGEDGFSLIRRAPLAPARCVTHVIFGRTGCSRREILINGSIIKRFLDEVRDAAVQVVSPSEAENGHPESQMK